MFGFFFILFKSSCKISIKYIKNSIESFWELISKIGLFFLIFTHNSHGSANEFESFKFFILLINFANSFVISPNELKIFSLLISFL